MAHKHNRHLIVFTRFPEAGTTKTRLIPSLGAEGAADLQRKMTEHILARVSIGCITPGTDIEIRYAGGNVKRMQNWLGPRYTYHPQGRGDLGCRMSSAFEDAFRSGADQVVLIGTDIPDITATTLKTAFDTLGHADLALGPAKDGGYYLIGLNHEVFAGARMLFAGIKWGAASVLADTLKIADASGLSTRLLEALTDVDDPQDLQVWNRVIGREAGNFRGPG